MKGLDLEGIFFNKTTQPLERNIYVILNELSSFMFIGFISFNRTNMQLKNSKTELRQGRSLKPI